MAKRDLEMRQSSDCRKARVRLWFILFCLRPTSQRDVGEPAMNSGLREMPMARPGAADAIGPWSLLMADLFLTILLNASCGRNSGATISHRSDLPIGAMWFLVRGG